MVFDVSEQVASTIDPRSKLAFCAINNVFRDPKTVLLGFGIPNVFLTVPGIAGGWQKFSAFMFWRKPSYVVARSKRLQLGVYYELRNLPEAAVAALQLQMKLQHGRRTASCANANARVLDAAGFTCGGKSLKTVYRPSKLAALIWEHGLEFEGEPVSIRVVQAGREASDHFKAAWLKELTSLCRSIKKKLLRGTPASSGPSMSAVEQLEFVSTNDWDGAEAQAVVKIGQPSWVGVWLGFIFGQRTIFSAELAEPMTDPALATPLPPFAGTLSRISKLKKYTVFSRPPVGWMHRQMVRRFEECGSIPRSKVIRMLRHSPGGERKTAFAYNVVILPDELRLIRLENRNGHDRVIINWLTAKHLVAANYDPRVVFAGELWSTLNGEDGKPTVYLNANSGSYKPSPDRLEAAAEYLTRYFNVRVVTVPVP